MIEVLNPGWFSLIVDQGRLGYSAIGVPPSAALDQYAYRALNGLVGTAAAPVIEALGTGFSLRFHEDLHFALTGAAVTAYLNDEPVRPWKTERALRGSVLEIREVSEGLRYYVGFSGGLRVETVMESGTTNLECRFGGHEGRTLRKGDRLTRQDLGDCPVRVIPAKEIPAMHPPHRLRILAGPEFPLFEEISVGCLLRNGKKVLYTASNRQNRTGIRLEGPPISFRPEAPRSIISEGILPGTIQVPGDGQPFIMLHERTIGGYARLGMVIRADQDRLAHLKAGDPVFLEMTTTEEAEALWQVREERLAYFDQMREVQGHPYD